MPARTLYEKIWDSHVVAEEPGKPALIYIDRHLVHEATSPQAFSGLKVAGRKVRRPDLTFSVVDHSVPTKNRHLPITDTVAAAQMDALAATAARPGSCFLTCTVPTRALSTSSGRNWASLSRA